MRALAAVAVPLLLCAALAPRAAAAAAKPKTAAGFLAAGKAQLARAAQPDLGEEAASDAAAQAVSDFHAAFALDRRNARALTLSAEARLYLLGAPARDAVEELDRALILDPRDALAWRLRGLFRQDPEIAEPANALADCREAAALDPKDPEAFSCVAEAQHALKRYGLAEDAYARAAALSPRDALLLCRRAQNLLAARRFKEALRQCDASIALDPRPCAAWRGQLAREQGREAARTK